MFSNLLQKVKTLIFVRKKFTNNLVIYQGYFTKSNPKAKGFTEISISHFNYQYKILRAGIDFKEIVINKIPKWQHLLRKFWKDTIAEIWKEHKEDDKKPHKSQKMKL